ncbi:MAG: insulinase family protein [Methylococcales bacterium]|nr:insulinase family protein [Methylococcales bacterium]
MPIKIIFLSLLIFSCTTQAVVKIEKWQTSQGVPVYYVNSPSLPMVDINILFDAGSARDGKQQGIASFTSVLLGTAAGKWSTDQVSQRFESIGAEMGSSSGMDYAGLSMRSLTDPKLFNKALSTLEVVLTQPTFSKKDFNRDQKRLLTALKRRGETPGSIAGLAYKKALYGEHPYAYPSSGYIKTVSKFTPKEVQAFYKKYYVSANAMIVIVGALDKKQAQATAEKLMAKLPKGKKPEPIVDVNVPRKGTLQYISFPSTQTHVLVGFPALTRHDKDYMTLYVGNHILGGSGLVSKLFKEVREERGLAYSASSSFSPMIKKGAFTIGLQTKNEQREEALKVLMETVNTFIDNGVTAEELTAAKKNITGGFVLRFDNNSKLMSYVSAIGFHQLPLDYLETFPQRVEAVTAAQIKETFKRRVVSKLFQTIMVGGEIKKTTADKK